MAFYTNRTRHAAIVTIKVTAANDLKTAIKIGLPETLTSHEVSLGYNDMIIPAGESIELENNTEADLISTRSAD